jgi:hypothetical protein
VIAPSSGRESIALMRPDFSVAAHGVVAPKLLNVSVIQMVPDDAVGRSRPIVSNTVAAQAA